MQTTNLDIGSYCIGAGTLLGSFENECVGSRPAFVEGIVFTRIDGDRVYVSDWHIADSFQGEQALEQFEEAKHNQDFDFEFFREREIKEGEVLDGTNPALKKQLEKKLFSGVLRKRMH